MPGGSDRLHAKAVLAFVVVLGLLLVTCRMSESSDTGYVLGIPMSIPRNVMFFIGDGHLPYEFDGLGSLPAIEAMTQKAIEMLSAGDDGFFVMTEAGRIDHASHDNDLTRMIEETPAFAAAVAQVVE